MLMILSLSLTVIGCNGIKVRVESDCLWADPAPDLTDAQAAEVKTSNLSDDTVRALNRLDNFVDKHNQMEAKFC